LNRCLWLQANSKRTGTPSQAFLRAHVLLTLGPVMMSANSQFTPGQDELLMIVEDDRSVAGLLDRVLSDEGYRTMHAGDGMEAIEVLQHGIVPSVILLDLLMPRMGGLELVERLERDDTFCNIPIILMSGHSALARGDKVRGLHLLPKPFDSAHLLRLIRILARQSASRWESAGFDHSRRADESDL
jgi:two-component system response regulator VicR